MKAEKKQKTKNNSIKPEVLKAIIEEIVVNSAVDFVIKNNKSSKLNKRKNINI